MIVLARHVPIGWTACLFLTNVSVLEFLRLDFQIVLNLVIFSVANCKLKKDLATIVGAYSLSKEL